MTVRRKNGFTLIAAIFIVLVMTMLAITMSTFISSDSVVSARNYSSQKAFFIASAGSEYYMKQLIGDLDWTTPPTAEAKPFSDGIFTVTTTAEQKNRITVTVTGIVTKGAATYTRTLRASLRRMGGGLGSIAEEYAVYVAGSDTTAETYVGNNVTINGDILVSGDLEFGSNAVVSGDAQAGGDITGDTTGITGDTDPATELPEEPPSVESTYYDAQIAIAASYPSGDKSYNGNKTVSGVTYVNGNVTFGNNATITVTGVATIVATGTVLVSNNTTIGDNFHMIAAGLITLENNVIVGKYGRWYSSTGFELANNTETGSADVGEGTAFITPGDIDIGNNVTFDGFLYAGGTLTIGNNMDFSGLILAGELGDIGENSTLEINPQVIDWDGLTGFEGTEGNEETHVTDWDEVY